MAKDISFLANDLIKMIELEASKTLRTSGEILVSEIKQEVVALVDNSDYEPHVYVRTHKLEKSIKKSPVQKDATGISIDIYADDKVAKSRHMYKRSEALEPYADIVETGQGYDYGFPSYGKPRRFVGIPVDKEKNGIIGLLDRAIGDAIRRL